MNLTHKICTHCHVDKPAAEYTPRSRVKSGLSSWCCDCVNTKARAADAAIRDSIYTKRWLAWYDRRAGYINATVQVMT